MRFLSICSGIEAASAAWEPLGWQAVGFSEIDKFASAVLAHRHPAVQNFGDMLGYRSWDVPPFDILVGGPPCQAFSVSGLQHGLADPRGQLSLTYCDLADHFDPAFTLWENVPGVLSNRTNPFGCLLGRLCGADAPLLPESGHVWPGAGILSGPKRTLAWRTLDAQYFGLAQRRKRVFLLASRGSGNWTGAAALFPVSEGVPGNTPPRRGTGTAVAALTACGVGTCGADDNQAQAGHLIRSYRTSGNCGAWDTGDVTDALTTGTDPCSHIIANCLTAREGKGPDSDATTTLVIAPALTTTPYADTAAQEAGLVPDECGVRRLLPRECERLQGFTAQTERVIIRACLDRQSQTVDVVVKCLKSPSNALPAEGERNLGSASSAGLLLKSDPGNRGSAVILHVQQSHETSLQEIRSGGKSAWSANGAAQADGFHLPMPPADIARALVHLRQGLEVLTRGGKAASLVSETRFTLPESGSWCARWFGQESAEVANDAVGLREGDTTFTTSNLSLPHQASEHVRLTWLCSALGVIGSCIPKRTFIGNICEVWIDVESDHTLIPFGRKPAADAPRYKAIGNSMAVNVMRWIGERILFAQSIMPLCSCGTVKLGAPPLCPVCD